MGMYNYGIGGNEVKVDANESIAEIHSLMQITQVVMLSSQIQ